MLSYGSNLAPIINNTWRLELVGKPTDPTRFDERDLLEREKPVTEELVSICSIS